jgi:hypothetical protein
LDDVDHKGRNQAHLQSVWTDPSIAPLCIGSH